MSEKNSAVKNKGENLYLASYNCVWYDENIKYSTGGIPYETDYFCKSSRHEAL